MPAPFPKKLTTASLISAMMACFFYFDLQQPLGVAGGIPYILLIPMALAARSRVLVILTTGGGMILTVLGVVYSPPGAEMNIVLINRNLAIVVMLAIAVLCTKILRLQGQLDSSVNQLVNTDSLTGTGSRRALMEALRHRIEEAQRYNFPLSVILADVDQFKAINDRHGHLAGDTVLRHVCELLKKQLRDADYLGRYGGDEFVIVCPHIDGENAKLLVRRLEEVLRRSPCETENACLTVTLSFGVGQLLPEQNTPEALLRVADTSMYQNKQNRRDRGDSTPPASQNSGPAQQGGPLAV